MVEKDPARSSRVMLVGFEPPPPHPNPIFRYTQAQYSSLSVQLDRVYSERQTIIVDKQVEMAVAQFHQTEWSYPIRLALFTVS